MTDEEARRLVAEILFDCPDAADEADRIVRTVVKTWDILAYEPDDSARSAGAVALSRAAYARTRDCAERMDQFAMCAGATFGEDRTDEPDEKAA